MSKSKIDLTLEQYAHGELSARGYLDDIIHETITRVERWPHFALLRGRMHYRLSGFPLPLVNSMIEALIHEADSMEEAMYYQGTSSYSF